MHTNKHTNTQKHINTKRKHTNIHVQACAVLSIAAHLLMQPAEALLFDMPLPINVSIDTRFKSNSYTSFKNTNVYKCVCVRAHTHACARVKGEAKFTTDPCTDVVYKYEPCTAVLVRDDAHLRQS
jgi:hypothetical protein